MVKVLLIGDVMGQVEEACRTVTKMTTDFDLCLSTGRFSSEDMDIQEGECKCPFYFVDSGDAAQDLVEDSPDGDTLGESLHFLGHFGVKKIQGLTIAYLSGTYDEVAYHKTDALFVDGHYTKTAIDRLLEEIELENQIDILVTCEWPNNVEQFAKKRKGTGATQPSGSSSSRGHKDKQPPLVVKEEKKLMTVTPNPETSCPKPSGPGRSGALLKLLETEPRYWLVSGKDAGPWKREPWRHRRRAKVNQKTGETVYGVTRFISLDPITEGECAFNGVSIEPYAVPTKEDWDNATPAPWEDPEEVEKEKKEKEKADAAAAGPEEKEKIEWKPSFGMADDEERRRWRKAFGINPEDLTKYQNAVDKANEPKEKGEKRVSLYKHQRPDKKKRGGGSNLTFQQRERMALSRQ